MEILKKFRNILLGQQFKVYTDHKNLRYKIFSTEEYNLELIYVQGSKNIAADVLNRLDIVDANNIIKPNMSSLAKHISLEK